MNLFLGNFYRGSGPKKELVEVKLEVQDEYPEEVCGWDPPPPLEPNPPTKRRRKETKPHFLDSDQYDTKVFSPYLNNIALILICYGLCEEISENTFMHLHPIINLIIFCYFTF